MHLFISFTATLRAIANKEVSEAELNGGTFYFGCARSHAFEPWQDEVNELTWFFTKEIDGERKYDSDAAAAGHQLLVQALQKAEAAGRAAWREAGQRQTYACLLDLLVANGAINHRAHGLVLQFVDDRPYCNPTVCRLIEMFDPDITVIC